MRKARAEIKKASRSSLEGLFVEILSYSFKGNPQSAVATKDNEIAHSL